MNELLKQRLVGALILIALGVVFWPIIFVEPGTGKVSGFTEVPARPMVNTVPIPSPDKGDMRESPEFSARSDAEAASDEQALIVEPALPVEAEIVVAAEPEILAAESQVGDTEISSSEVRSSKTRTEAPEKPVIDVDGVPVAWILQVASISDAEKADELRQKLIKMGFQAYSKKIYSSGKSLHRVYIGPKFERAKLERMQSEVNKSIGVQSMIVRYVP